MRATSLRRTLKGIIGSNQRLLLALAHGTGISHYKNLAEILTVQVLSLALFTVMSVAKSAGAPWEAHRRSAHGSNLQNLLNLALVLTMKL